MPALLPPLPPPADPGDDPLAAGIVGAQALDGVSLKASEHYQFPLQYPPNMQ